MKSNQHTRPDQAWFWSERWQKMERQVDDDLASGQMLNFDCVEDAIQTFHDACTPDADTPLKNKTNRNPSGGNARNRREGYEQ